MKEDFDRGYILLQQLVVERIRKYLICPKRIQVRIQARNSEVIRSLVGCIPMQLCQQVMISMSSVHIQI